MAKPTTTSSSARGCSSALDRCGVPALDTSQITNQQNPFWLEHRKESGAAPKGSVLYRLHPPLEPGERKLLRCGTRTVAVFRTEDGYHAFDNACYHHGGPLFLGDIEEVDGAACVVCPWHRSKVEMATGVALYEAMVDVDARLCKTAEKDGPRQRIHEVVFRDGVPCVKLNTAEHGTYASDRYAAVDIASNDERAMTQEMADEENSSREAMQQHIRRRRSSLKMEQERRRRDRERAAKNPVRVPAGQLTPRGKDSGPYVPSWVRQGKLPPDEPEEDDHQWVPAHDLAEEYRDLEEEYAKRREAAEAASKDPRLADLGL
eukprot:TRINITY_DN39732_c0_g1_i1.p1 TRINITY_DN39732_c0_g1~~TRINITY_DN39732_c0_g1_i1.p1  ORF type:complete len:318 (+),score=96.70 TRINITY_DN39732_c0_g1_i1:114-1067(+)